MDGLVGIETHALYSHQRRQNRAPWDGVWTSGERTSLAVLPTVPSESRNMDDGWGGEERNSLTALPQMLSGSRTTDDGWAGGDRNSPAVLPAVPSE